MVCGSAGSKSWFAESSGCLARGTTIPQQRWRRFSAACIAGQPTCFIATATTTNCLYVGDPISARSATLGKAKTYISAFLGLSSSSRSKAGLSLPHAELRRICSKLKTLRRTAGTSTTCTATPAYYAQLLKLRSQSTPGSRKNYVSIRTGLCGAWLLTPSITVGSSKSVNSLSLGQKLSGRLNELESLPLFFCNQPKSLTSKRLWLRWVNSFLILRDC